MRMIGRKSVFTAHIWNGIIGIEANDILMKYVLLKDQIKCLICQLLTDLINLKLEYFPLKMHNMPASQKQPKSKMTDKVRDVVATDAR